MVRTLTLILLLLFGPLAGALRAEGNLSLTLITETRNPVVGEMIEVTIRGVYDRKIANEDLVIAPTDAFDWIQTHPDDWHEERIDGLPWIVFERRIAIWPRRAGTLQFGPVEHRLTVIDLRSQRRDVTVKARPLAVSVGEFPALKGWHMTGRAVELTDEVSTDAARLADGQLVTRTVRLRALGALPEHLPPRPVVSENWLITFAAPVERKLTLTEAGPVAEAVWTWQFRPHTGEPGMLDPVKIPFFNTREHRLDAVEIPPLAIGLASFYTGQRPTGRVGAGQIAFLSGVTLAGLLGGLGVGLWRLAPDLTRSGFRRLRSRWSPFLRVQLLRARRRGDLLGARRIMEEIGRPEAERHALDRRIYGRPASRGAQDEQAGTG
ncbi:hypothetical protein [uncultured Paracoccus sp.]|uniref:hypothetical protein n=1 Tax=uncultured Paracoccus sp. TaxID=189685 RepID=UPI00260FDA66|nr:hypothetical protein [uncultured Paracoccus sp.]